MKELLNLEMFGVRLYQSDNEKYRAEYDETYFPGTREVDYETEGEAIADIITFILDPENVYVMEDQPEEIQMMYNLIGCPHEQNPGKYTLAAATMLEYVLTDIVRGNEERRN